jgi:hypothetical protein
MAAAVRARTGAVGLLRISAAKWALSEVARGRPWDRVGGRRRGGKDRVGGRRQGGEDRLVAKDGEVRIELKVDWYVGLFDGPSCTVGTGDGLGYTGAVGIGRCGCGALHPLTSGRGTRASGGNAIIHPLTCACAWGWERWVGRCAYPDCLGLEGG